MNKIAIPALLVATVMVAGMFAFAPVEQASTVHQSQASGDSLVRNLTWITLESVDIGDNNSADGVADILMLYDGIGNSRTVDIEVNTNMVAAALLDIDSAADGELIMESHDGATWTQVTTGWTTITGSDHRDFAEIEGLRLRQVDSGGAGATITFQADDYLSLTITGN